MSPAPWLDPTPLTFWEQIERINQHGPGSPWPAEAIPWLLAGMRRVPATEDWGLQLYIQCLRSAPPCPESIAALLAAIFDDETHREAVAALHDMGVVASDMRFPLMAPVPTLPRPLPIDADAVVGALPAHRPRSALAVRALLAHTTPALRASLVPALQSGSLADRELAARGLRPSPSEADLSDVIDRIFYQRADTDTAKQRQIARLGAMGVHAIRVLPWLCGVLRDTREPGGVIRQARAATRQIGLDCRQYEERMRLHLQRAVALKDTDTCCRLLWGFSVMRSEYSWLRAALGEADTSLVVSARRLLAQPMPQRSR